MWIPDETPVLETVFVDYAPEAEDIATVGGPGLFDSFDLTDDYVALDERIWAQMDALETVAYHAGLARLRAWQWAELDYELAGV